MGLHYGSRLTTESSSVQTLKDRFLQAASDSCAPCMAFPAMVTTAQLTHRDLILSLPLKASQLPAGPQFLSGSPPGGQDDSHLSLWQSPDILLETGTGSGPWH